MPRTPAPQAGEEFLPGLSLSFRASARAKRLILRMLPGQGLEVVIPNWATRKDADRLIAAKRGWIERTARRMMAEGVDLTGALPELPETLELRALATTLPITWTDRPGRLTLRENAGRLSLSGPLGGEEDSESRLRAFARLREYVRSQAKTHLPPRIRAMSRDIGLEFGEVAIRCQRSRWGSCARQGSATRISLNAKLLFLPPRLCDQVLLHELCHLRHHDHSKAYWALVESLNPAARELERELGSGHCFVPPWWNASFL